MAAARAAAEASAAKAAAAKAAAEKNAHDFMNAFADLDQIDRIDADVALPELDARVLSAAAAVEAAVAEVAPPIVLPEPRAEVAAGTEEDAGVGGAEGPAGAEPPDEGAEAEAGPERADEEGEGGEGRHGRRRSGRGDEPEGEDGLQARLLRREPEDFRGRERDPYAGRARGRGDPRDYYEPRRPYERPYGGRPYRRDGPYERDFEPPYEREPYGGYERGRPPPYERPYGRERPPYEEPPYEGGERPYGRERPYERRYDELYEERHVPPRGRRSEGDPMDVDAGRPPRDEAEEVDARGEGWGRGRTEAEEGEGGRGEGLGAAERGPGEEADEGGKKKKHKKKHKKVRRAVNRVWALS